MKVSNRPYGICGNHIRTEKAFHIFGARILNEDLGNFVQISCTVTIVISPDGKLLAHIHQSPLNECVFSLEMRSQYFH